MNDSFLEYVKDQFEIVGPITIRRMFGGAGIFLDGVMFGLIADDLIYLKVGESNKQDFIDAGMGPFTYEGKNKPIQMSYYQLPEGALDDPDELREWAQKAIRVSREGKK